MDTGAGLSRFYYNNWYRIGLFNLLLVATVGLLLRFKMAASLPWVNHKYFLHGHSHFAFSGWVSLVLMVAIVQRIHKDSIAAPPPAFRILLWMQLVSAYGMLLSFPFMGYAALSITFSTVSILVSYAFVWAVWKKCNAGVWGSKTAAFSIKAAMIFLVISSLGAFWLAFLMASHSGTQSLFFSALYFFLHFQYNGWFFFGILGLCLTMLPAGILQGHNRIHRGAQWMVAACVPAVTLSGLWMKVPGWLYGIAIASALMQLTAVFYAWKPIRENLPGFTTAFSKIEKNLLSVSAFAFLARVLLQALSTIPALSKFAFGYRPVVIGYLHLILLGCITMFLFTWLIGKNIWAERKKVANQGFVIFFIGFLLTEFTLMAQGLGYIGWTNIPYTNQMLLWAAVLLFAGLVLLNISAQTKKN